MRFALTTRATPEQVLRAMTDFSDRRLETWSRSLDPQRYELRELGESWAVARESTRHSPYWVVLRYDWSDPSEVRWTEIENSYGGHGAGSVRIVPTKDGGSRLHADWGASPAPHARDRVALFLIHRLLSPVAARMWKRALDRYAMTEAAEPGSAHTNGSRHRDA